MQNDKLVIFNYITDLSVTNYNPENTYILVCAKRI